MKFLTDEEILKAWFGTSGRFGPAGEALAFARQIEAMAAKELLSNANDSLKWMTAKEK